MFSPRAVVASVGSLALVASLSGCSLLDNSTTEEPLTGVAACALGHTWQLDMTDLGAQLLAELQRQKVPATEVVASGTQTIDWGTDSRLTLDSDFEIRITAPIAADQTITVVSTYGGSATGAAFINGEVAIPRDWKGADQTSETVADNNGTPLETVPWAIPSVQIDDTVGLELTCDGSTMTIHPRGSKITQTWTR